MPRRILITNIEGGPDELEGMPILRVPYVDRETTARDWIGDVVDALRDADTADLRSDLAAVVLAFDGRPSSEVLKLREKVWRHRPRARFVLVVPDAELSWARAAISSIDAHDEEGELPTPPTVATTMEGLRDWLAAHRFPDPPEVTGYRRIGGGRHVPLHKLLTEVG